MEATPSSEPVQSSGIEPKYLFIALTLALVIGIVSVEQVGITTEVINDWSERRCDLDILMTSFRYKPPDDSRSIAQFAADNFQFCVTSKTSAYLETIFGVLFEVMRKQFAAGEIMTQVFKVLRVQLNSIYKPFSELMNRFFTKFKQIGSLASRVFQQIFMAMKKAAATAIASIFVALSLQTIFLNTIDFIIKVIMIVLYICMALIFIFFLPILPLLVIVLITVVGIEKAMPGSTGPMGSVFCFHKDTNVIMKSGDQQHICLLKPGDVLKDNILVQAVIEVPGEQLYDLDGILVSGYHCLYDEDDVIYVKDHPRAKKSTKYEETLWTLITDKREIPVMGSNGPLRFLDWDEIPDSREAEKAWEMVAFGILNGNDRIVPKMVPTSAPCLDRSLKVWMHQGGWRPLHTVKVGDWIYGKDCFVKVTGLCERIVHTAIGCEQNRMTDGNWILHGENEWKHPVGKIENVKWQGIQLITDLGYFKVQMLNGQEYVVRDFTEVGAQQILSSHARVESLLEEK
jgi:hypothetical protein